MRKFSDQNICFSNGSLLCGHWHISAGPDVYLLQYVGTFVSQMEGCDWAAPQLFCYCLNKDCLFIQITVNLTCKPAWPLSAETTSGLKSIPSSGERNESSKGGSNRWGSRILLDIYLGGALSTIKQNLSPIPPTLDCGLTLSCNSQILVQVTPIRRLLYSKDASGQPQQILTLSKNTIMVLTLHSR